MSLADDWKARAIAFRVANAQAQQVRVQQLIGALASEAEARIDGQQGWGAAYLQVDNNAENQETVEAIRTTYGKQYLANPDLGFSVEDTGTAVIIRWASDAEINAAVDAIINPPIAPETPANEVPSVEDPLAEKK